MTFDPLPTAIYELCHQAAQNIYGIRPPTPAYASRVTDLLFGTAAHESAGFKHTRQIGFNNTHCSGAWSYWQLEWPSIHDSILHLRRNLALAHHTAQFLEILHPDAFDPLVDHPFDRPPAYDTARLAFLNLTRTWPRLAVALARLHYLRNPDPIPQTLLQQAHYWKRIYNTDQGAGTTAAYLASWNLWAAPHLEHAPPTNQESPPPL